MRNETIAVEPIAGSLGAILHGVDLATMDDAQFGEVHDAFLRHKVIFFRGQDITPDQQVAFCRRFGEIHLHPYIAGIEGHPEVIRIIKRETDSYVFGGTWHTDQAFTSKPALGTVLYAKTVPPAGGDTMFADMAAAYDALSDTMKAMLAGLKTVNTGDKSRGKGGKSRAERYAGTEVALKDPGEIEKEAIHPLIRTHPETGRKSIYLSSHTQKILGMTQEESDPILNYLQKHAVKPEFTCRFRWEVGSLAIWDNRCTQHLALDDYSGHRREMHRVTIKGDTPF